VVFADEPVWTVVPDRVVPLVRQRLAGWYPAHYHMFVSYLRLLFRRSSSWRLRHEMAYCVFVVLSEPFRIWSLGLILYQRLWVELGLLYGLYLLLETYPFLVIPRRFDTGRRWLVLLLYPAFGLVNAAAPGSSGSEALRDRRDAPQERKDRKWNQPAGA
jgi:hypothetical protein